MREQKEKGAERFLENCVEPVRNAFEREEERNLRF